MTSHRTPIAMLQSLLLTIALLFASPAFAHPGGHGPPVDEAQALAIAENVARRLADEDFGLGFGQLKPSWKELPAGSVRTHIKGQGFMIMAVENPKESRTLFVLMSENGSVYDANFTGVFGRLTQPQHEQSEPPKP